MTLSAIEPLSTSIGTLESNRPAGAAAPGKASPAVESAEGSGTVRFADLLRQVAAGEQAAEQATRSYAAGTSQNLHETMVSLQMADIRFSLLVTVRNKLLEAYREVMRMS